MKQGQFEYTLYTGSINAVTVRYLGELKTPAVPANPEVPGDRETTVTGSTP